MSLEGKSDDEIRALAELADDVLSKPKTAGVFQRLVKENNPNIAMPLIDIEDRTAAALAERDKQIKTLTDENERTKAEQMVNRVYESLREDGLVGTRASFSELVKFASERGFQTTEAGLRLAARAQVLEKESAEPTPQMGQGGFEIGGTNNEQSKELMKDPAGYARRMAAQAMKDMEKARAKGAKAH